MRLVYLDIYFQVEYNLSDLKSQDKNKSSEVIILEKMSESAREARNKYYREYRAKHPEKVKAQNRKYWQRVAERTKADGRENDAANPHD